jgi:pyruvate dehydrogenase E2 component (dihydrolipoamide acetyltransferase)
MLTPVTVPKASISMEEGSIVQWIKAEGDAISKDDVLFEMETDKAIVEVEAPVDGVLLRIVTAQGPIKVEAVVGWIGQPGDAVEIATDAQSITPLMNSNGIPSLQESKPLLGRILATPAARRRAAELLVEMEKVQPSTAGRRITEVDVEQFASLRDAKGEEPTPILTNRKTLIDRLSTTWQTVPHIHVARYLDARGLVEAKRNLRGTEISVSDLLLRVLALTLPRFPELSMVWGGERLIGATQINLAFAVHTDRGVVAPVISAANALGLEELSQRRRELADAARYRRLRPEDLHGGVFTLTNLGMQGVDFFAPVINAPQTAILAAGKISHVPVVNNDEVSLGWRMWVNLAVDHRVADGMAAARFLEQLQAEIEQLPERLRTHP